MIAVRLLHDRTGATAVESAMLSPVFLLLTFSVVDAGQLVWTQMTLEHAVESAARCAALRTSTCVAASDVKTYAVTQAPGLTLPASVFSYSTPSCGAQVTASYTYYFVSNSFPNATTTVTATSCLPFTYAQ